MYLHVLYLLVENNANCQDKLILSGSLYPFASISFSWLFCKSSEVSDLFSCRLLVHDPSQRLGANGASEVVWHAKWFKITTIIPAEGYMKMLEIKSIIFSIFVQVKEHRFFKGVDWDNLALQKVGYWTSRLLFLVSSWYCSSVCSK